MSPVQILVQSNCLSEQIRVLEGEVEEVSAPEMVDVIVSEPMGYMLLNDRLMERFLQARKWLKPNGRSKSFSDAEVSKKTIWICWLVFSWMVDSTDEWVFRYFLTLMPCLVVGLIFTFVPSILTWDRVCFDLGPVGLTYLSPLATYADFEFALEFTILTWDMLALTWDLF